MKIVSITAAQSADEFEFKQPQVDANPSPHQKLQQASDFIGPKFPIALAFLPSKEVV